MSYTEIWCSPELLSTDEYYKRLGKLRLEMPESTIEQLENVLNKRCELERLECKRVLDFVLPAPLYMYIDAYSESEDRFFMIKHLPSHNLNECLETHNPKTPRYALLDVQINGDHLYTTEIYNNNNVEVVADKGFCILKSGQNPKWLKHFSRLTNREDIKAVIDHHTLPVGRIARCLLKNRGDLMSHLLSIEMPSTE